ncbi:hypothetical protein Z950_892 [Sulfitobacter mediterraneus KCTC 32188]|nr:hypothetical protein Z950_892 [Sulfitobacter mediterraneus KCTC 32188]
MQDILLSKSQEISLHPFGALLVAVQLKIAMAHRRSQIGILHKPFNAVFNVPQQ